MRAAGRGLHHRTLVALAAISVLVGCAGGGDGTPSSPGRGSAQLAGDETLETRRFQPATEGAIQYGETSMFRPNAAERVMLSTLSQDARAHDPALSAMARSLAVGAPSAGEFPAGLVAGLLAWHGLPDPPPSVFVVETDTATCAADPGQESCRSSMEALIQESVSSLPVGVGALFGVGVATTDEGQSRFIITYLDRAVDLRLVPRAAALGARVPIRGILLGDREAPRVEVVDALGRLQRLPAAVGSDGSFDAAFLCPQDPGVVQVEVLCEGAHGVEVAANFPVMCGAALEDAVTYVRERPDSNLTPTQVARRLFDLTNEVRAEAGLSQLRWSNAAAEVAISHSEDMVAHSFVGHISPRTGSAVERFSSARLEGAVLRENVARGYGPYEIHRSLMDSPSHRANILADDISHLGVGVVLSPPETAAAIAPIPIYVTQNFYREVGTEPPGDLTNNLLSAVSSRRANDGLARVPVNGGLHGIASD
ncbi:MAG: CAP domain-containing protein, partial [Nannocystaceae bacterium]